MKFLVAILYIIVLGYYGYPLLKNREYREFLVFIFLMVFSLYYVLAVMFSWPLINPAMAVVKIPKLLTGFFK